MAQESDLRCGDLHCDLVPVAVRQDGWATHAGCKCLNGLAPNKKHLVRRRLDQLFEEIETLEREAADAKAR